MKMGPTSSNCCPARIRFLRSVAEKERLEPAIVPSNKEKTITAASQVSAIDYNVFEGHKVKGLPRYTLTRGQVAVTDGVMTSEEGHGKFVERKGATPTNTALSTWKELTAPRPVKRSGIPASGV